MNKTSKFKLTLIALLFSSKLMQAQKNLEIYSGYNLYSYGNAGLRKSMRSFEEYWKNNGEPNIQVKGYKTAHDFNFGLNYITNNKDLGSTFILGLQHFRFTNECEAKFEYGTRHFKTINRAATLYAGKKNSKGITYKLGFGFGNSVLESFFEYPNKVISYGKEKHLNGVYGTTYSMNLNFEITKQKIFFNHLGVEVGAVFMSNGFTTEYYDPTYAKGVNAPVNYSWIPQDFNAFYQAVNTSGGVYEGKNVKSNHISVGLVFRVSYFLKPIEKN